MRLTLTGLIFRRQRLQKNMPRQFYAGEQQQYDHGHRNTIYMLVVPVERVLRQMDLFQENLNKSRTSGSLATARAFTCLPFQ